jgi:hypothetical protein
MFRSAHERTHLFQITFSRGNISSKNYPMSRAFLYRDDSPSPALSGTLSPSGERAG